MEDPTTHLALKVKHGDDIRRFSVQKNLTFGELHHLISKHFVIAPEHVQLKYIDDEEELITLGSDLELQEAKRLQPSVLRLNVYEVRPQHEADAPNEHKLEATFVRDETVTDGTHVTADVKFRKVWRVKNTGHEPWPKGVFLKMVDPKDEQLIVLAPGAISRPIAADEECDIGVELQAPTRPGRCVQYWRLFTEDGEVFGARLWIDITVVDEEELRRSEEEKQRAESERQKRILHEEEQKRLAEEQGQVELRKKLEEEQEERKRIEEEQARLAEIRQQQEEQERKRVAEELERQRVQEEQKRLEAEELKRKDSKYPVQLNALAEMGFTNTEHNICLLDKCKGSIDLALEALLAGN